MDSVFRLYPAYFQAPWLKQFIIIVIITTNFPADGVLKQLCNTGDWLADGLIDFKDKDILMIYFKVFYVASKANTSEEKSSLLSSCYISLQ